MYLLCKDRTTKEHLKKRNLLAKKRNNIFQRICNRQASLIIGRFPVSQRDVANLTVCKAPLAVADKPKAKSRMFSTILARRASVKAQAAALRHGHSQVEVEGGETDPAAR